jgi:GTP-binding protein
LKILSAEFVRSAAGPADFPRDPVPQVAFVGRSNVGKSSLINALARRRIARTSAAAGKTRLVNIYRLSVEAGAHTELYLVDLPGYGYARGGAASVEAFEALTTAYFECPARHDARHRGLPLGPTAVVFIVDARHPGLERDLAAWTWLASLGRPVELVATKIDKLSRAERASTARKWQEVLNVPVLPVSAVSGEGLNDLWMAIIRRLQHNRQATS